MANTGGSVSSTGGAAAEPCSEYGDPTPSGTLFPEATGISGIVASRDQPGVFYVHSDRQKILFAIDGTGKLLGQWEVSNGEQFFFIYNWEDISVQSVDGGADLIWIGDIGNNYVRTPEEGDPRTSIRIMSIEEPSVDPGQVVDGTVTVVGDYEFTYPDGLHDAEAMAIDPLTGDLYVFSKEEEPPTGIYRARAPLASGELEYVGPLDSSNVNAADFSPSGRELLVRDYITALYWELPAGATWAETLTTAPNKELRLQWTEGYYSEAIGFSADESGFYVVSEEQEGSAPSPIEFYAKACE